MKGSIALRKPVAAPVANDCSGTTITSAAYVTMVAVLAAPASAMEVINTSAKAIKIAFGAAGSEVDQYAIAPGAFGQIIPVEAKKGIRVSAEAYGANATTGFLIINWLG